MLTCQSSCTEQKSCSIVHCTVTVPFYEHISYQSRVKIFTSNVVVIKIIYDKTHDNTETQSREVFIDILRP